MAGLRRGMAALRQMKQQQGSGGGNGLRFIINDGETALVRVYGDFENDVDPLLGDTHYVKRLAKGNQYHNCANNMPEGHAGCVFCWAKNNGDKGISLSPRAYFHVKDMRKQHKFQDPVSVLKPGYVGRPGQQLPPAAYEQTQYPNCKGKNCQFCAQGNEAKINGHRHWELAVGFADQLVSMQAQLRDFCKCGARTEEGDGTIYTNRYMCGNENCGADVEFFPEQGKPVAACAVCKQHLPPLEEIACTGCNENGGTPARCDLSDFYFKVTRNGKVQDTTYNFEPVHPCRPPSDEELAEAAEKRPNFEEIMAPEPAELQARHLGIQSPFHTGGHGAQQYSDMPDAGPETNAPPRRAALPPGRGGPPQRQAPPQAAARAPGKPVGAPQGLGKPPVLRLPFGRPPQTNGAPPRRVPPSSQGEGEIPYD